MLRAMAAKAEFSFQELLPIGHHDDTPFKQLTSDHVSTFTARGKTFLDVAPEALTLLTRCETSRTCCGPVTSHSCD